MKTRPETHLKPKSKRRLSRKGIALITVLSLLAITTLLIAAFFSLAKMELVSSDNYANGIRSRQLADTAVNIAMSQIKKATVPPAGTNSIYYAWASQPGAIRKYDIRGNFYEAYKLYSDSNMIVDADEGEESLIEDSPPTDWWERPELYVDLNAPVVRRGSSGEFDERFYPIIDPRAMQRVTVERDPNNPSAPTELAPIKGFSYSDQYLDGTVDSQVVLPTNSGDFNDEGNDPHIPMPVEWLYVLQDGTLGFLDEENEDRFSAQGPDGDDVMASADNPIVGRIAFWTDDETTKINVNTASEPTFWNVPWLYSDIDLMSALRQPGRREFQRYPGHPASTALSPVLFPDMYDQYPASTPIETVLDGVQPMKEQIFDMVPRIGEGGSRSGTAEVNDLTDPERDFEVQPVQIDDDRLYASLDELIFSTELKTEQGIEKRSENPLLNARSLQRAQFFLTANSRAPETNIFNMPRISIWPIHRRAVPKDMGGDSDFEERYGTGFDRMVSFCSTVNGVPYYFKREDADDRFNDLRPAGIRSNFDLFHSIPKGYLWNLVDTVVPGYGKSFTDKYGDAEAHQIITEIFDYIRCTNLHDDLVAPEEGGFERVWGTRTNGTRFTDQPYRPDTTNFYTFTDPRDNITRLPDELDEHVYVFPGHGQVTPIETPSRAAGETSRGMGRFFTVSEVALHFICSADGNQFANGHPGGRPDGLALGEDNGAEVRNYLAGFALGAADTGGAAEDPSNVMIWGGAAAPGNGRISPANRFWFSGFPPLPPDLIPPPGPPNENPRSSASYPYYTKNPDYPGYKQENWNYALGTIPDGTTADAARNTYLLTEDERLVQMMVHFETFCPALGWTQINPEIHIVVKGLENFTLDQQPLYDQLTMGNLFFASAANGFNDGGQRGGINGVRGFVRNKHLPERSRFDDDISGGVPAIEADPEWTRRGTGTRTYLTSNLVSNIITVEGSLDGDPRMEFGGGPISVEVWLGRAPGEPGAEKIQTFEIDVPDGAFPQPQLVMYETNRSQNANTGRIGSQATAPPFWWAFHRSGCYGTGVRQVGQPNVANNPSPTRNVAGGRNYISGDGGLSQFDTTTSGAVSSREVNIRLGNFLRREDTIQSIVPWHGDYRHVLAAQNVSASDRLFIQHKHWATKQHAHNLYIAGRSDRAPDFARSNVTMLAGVGRNGQAYANHLWPDFPFSSQSINARSILAYFRDFDNAMGASPDGPYINKPDEGDARIVDRENAAGVVTHPGVPYLRNSWRNEATGQSYFSPNRQVPSPVMFGSLPSGIKGSPGVFGGRPLPWRTLLFRPPEIANPHTGERDQPKSGDVPDHLLLDFFWMPVVEPYAISEPFSTAGKININYQILPFTNIRRATGIHSLLLGEKIMCYGNDDTLDAKRQPGTRGAQGALNSISGQYWDNTQKQWWRDVDVEETLRQFDDLERGKFSKGEIFRTASEICEVNIVPTDDRGKTAEDGGSVRVDYNTGRKAWRMSEAGKEFYAQSYKVTGDNARERPYANIYPRVTTKSNTFQVHYRVQTLRKSNFTDPEKVDPDRDSVSSEFRGSSIIERYIDPNDPAIPDYREFKRRSDTPPLDKFYRYRIVSTKRFAP